LQQVLFSVEANPLQNSERLAPVNLLPITRRKLEQCNRTGLGSNRVFKQVDYPSCIGNIIHKMLNYGKRK
jgi:hypothetical protein